MPFKEERRKRTRRKSRRVVEPIPTLVFWEGKSGRHDAHVCDLGMGGCYLNTDGTPQMGERVALEIPASTASQRVVKFHGTVVPEDRKLKGFGLRFEALSEEQQSVIALCMVQAAEARERRK